jgi:hypothetical protein
MIACRGEVRFFGVSAKRRGSATSIEVLCRLIGWISLECCGEREGCRRAHQIEEHIEPLEAPGGGKELKQFGTEDEEDNDEDAEKERRAFLLFPAVFQDIGKRKDKEKRQVRELIYAYEAGHGGKAGRWQKESDDDEAGRCDGEFIRRYFFHMKAKVAERENRVNTCRMKRATPKGRPGRGNSIPATVSTDA